MQLEEGAGHADDLIFSIYEGLCLGVRDESD